MSIVADLSVLKAKKQAYSSESVRFEGPDGELCRFVNAYNVFRKRHRSKDNAKIELMMNRSLAADEKSRRLKDFYVEQATLEKNFLKANPSSYAWVLENERLSEYYGELFVLHWGREMPADLYEEAVAHQPRLISNAGMSHYYGYLSTYLFRADDREELALFQEALLPGIAIPEEAARLRALIELQQRKIEGQPYDEAQYGQEFSYFFRQYEREIHRAKVDAFIKQTAALPAEKRDMVKLVGGGEDIWQREQYVGKVLPTVHHAWCADLLRRDWEATREQLAAARKRLAAIRIETAPSTLGTKVGALPNGAELYQAGDPPLDTFLSALRAAHPGKALLLDIWAPWCGPCLYDMQNSAANLQKLREMDVEVVYLCVADGTNPQTWQQKVAELDLFAPQVFLGPELSTAIMRFFDLQGYPSHVFLDKSGQYHPGLVHSISRIDFGTLEEKL